MSALWPVAEAPGEPRDADAGPPAPRSSGAAAGLSAQTIFLGRDGYRQRRLRDALRLLPVVGAAAFLVPLLWPSAPFGDAAAGTSASDALVFVFGAWLVLIGLAAALGSRLRAGALGPGKGAAPPDRD